MALIAIGHEAKAMIYKPDAVLISRAFWPLFPVDRGLFYHCEEHTPKP